MNHSEYRYSEIQKPTHVDTAVRLLQKCASEKFWGSIEIHFQNGRVVMIRKTQVSKPEELEGNLPEHGGNRNGQQHR